MNNKTIEVTEAMKNAGLAVFERLVDSYSTSSLVAEIYKAMRVASFLEAAGNRPAANERKGESQCAKDRTPLLESSKKKPGKTFG